MLIFAINCGGRFHGDDLILSRTVRITGGETRGARIGREKKVLERARETEREREGGIAAFQI